MTVYGNFIIMLILPGQVINLKKKNLFRRHALRKLTKAVYYLIYAFNNSF